MSLRHLKPVLKRGCLLAAANWPVTLVQSAADFLFKLLLAVPLVGGIFLVALVVGAEPGSLMALEWRDLATTLVGSLVAHPLALVMFLLSLSTVVVGGSLFVFLMKAGTVGTLVAGERRAGPIEVPPLQFDAMARASAFSIETFTERAQALFPVYARLGFALMCVYLLSGLAYLAALYVSGLEGWTTAALFTVLFVGWITIVNLGYLLVQVVVAAESCGVRAGVSKTAMFVRREPGAVAGVFGVVLAMVIFATGASFVAAASLSLITFVPFLGPFLGLAALPLQVLAWLLREIVFEYIGLSSVGAYLRLYRGYVGRGNTYPVAPTQAAWEPSKP